MFNWALLVPISMFTVGPIAWSFNNWNRMRHGFEPERYKTRGERRREQLLGDERTVTLLANDNERLTGQVSRLEERIAVLERIATDPATRTAREIEALRDR